VLDWVFSAILLGSDLLFHRTRIRAMMEKQLTLAAPIWWKLNLSWAAFFLVMGAANLYVAFHFPTETWVNFKLFGGTGLMLVFIVIQGLLLSRHIEHEEKK
jgi:intracellular septation protein